MKHEYTDCFPLRKYENNMNLRSTIGLIINEYKALRKFLNKSQMTTNLKSSNDTFIIRFNPIYTTGDYSGC